VVVVEIVEASLPAEKESTVHVSKKIVLVSSDGRLLLLLEVEDGEEVRRRNRATRRTLVTQSVPGQCYCSFFPRGTYLASTST